MDGNYLTAGDLALIENRRGYGYGNGDCGYYRHGIDILPPLKRVGFLDAIV